MKLTCAIIDDEPLAISLLESYVNKTPFLSLAGKYNSAVNALPILSKEPVDLAFPRHPDAGAQRDGVLPYPRR